MTDIDFARLSPRFDRDLKAHGLRTALEGFLAGYLEPRPAFDSMADVRPLFEAVARKHAVTLAQIRSMSAVKAIVRARHELWYRLHVFGFSGPHIARWWKRDPSTVADARKFLRERRPELAAEIERARVVVPTVAREPERRAA